MADYLFMFRACVIAPIRFGLFLACMMILATLVSIVPQTHVKDVSSLMNRAMCFVLGLTVEVSGTQVTASVAPIVVSNHVGMIDVLLLLACEKVSFLSDVGIRNFYLIGPIWSYVAGKIGCVFVSRSDDSSRYSARKLIHDRVKSIKTKNESSRLVLFPEGTTSNGQGILEFKTGAFEPLAPIQPVVLMYENRQWGYCSVWSDVYFSYIMALPPSTVVVKYLPVMYPAEGESVEEYSERVRRTMVSEGGFDDFGDQSHPCRSHNHVTKILTRKVEFN